MFFLFLQRPSGPSDPSKVYAASGNCICAGGNSAARKNWTAEVFVSLTPSCWAFCYSSSPLRPCAELADSPSLTLYRGLQNRFESREFHFVPRWKSALSHQRTIQQYNIRKICLNLLDPLDINRRASGTPSSKRFDGSPARFFVRKSRGLVQ